MILSLSDDDVVTVVQSRDQELNDDHITDVYSNDDGTEN